MTWADAVIGNPSFYDVTYVLRDGSWTGRCEALHVTVGAATLELARNEMRRAARDALRSTHRGVDGTRRAVSVYTEQLQARRFVNRFLVGQVAGREPAQGPYVSDDGQLGLRTAW